MVRVTELVFNTSWQSVLDTTLFFLESRISHLLFPEKVSASPNNSFFFLFFSAHSSCVLFQFVQLYSKYTFDQSIKIIARYLWPLAPLMWVLLNQTLQFLWKISLKENNYFHKQWPWTCSQWSLVKSQAL